MPKGLIRYSTERALTEHYAANGIWGHVLRPRVLVYAGILARGHGRARRGGRACACR